MSPTSSEFCEEGREVWIRLIYSVIPYVKHDSLRFQIYKMWKYAFIILIYHCSAVVIIK